MALLDLKLRNTKLKLVTAKLWIWVEKLIANLGGRTIAMLTTALLITIVSIIFNDNWVLSIAKQNVVIGKIRTNLITLNALRSALYAAESAQRGYLLMQRPEYIAPYTQSLEQARNSIKVINNLVMETSDATTLQKELVWMAAISASVEAKAAEMKLTLNLAEQGKVNIAKQVVNLDQGVVEMNKFMEHTQLLIDKQNGNLDNLLKTRKNSLIMARLSLVGCALILIVLVVLVIKQLLSEITVKSELQQQLVKQNESNEKKLEAQSVLLGSLALDYQGDVERERQKLSRELHDELGSILTATKMDIAWVMKKVKETAPEVVDKLKKTNTYLDQGINFKRQIVEELHPSIITTFGFWPALKQLIDDAAERNQWQMTLNLPEQTVVVNEILSLITYRVVQETLNNANKYASATKVSINIIADELFLKIEIEDNGKGFDVDAIDGNTHGLAGMRHRILAIGGKFDIASQLNKGTITRVLIPQKQALKTS